ATQAQVRAFAEPLGQAVRQEEPQVGGGAVEERAGEDPHEAAPVVGADGQLPRPVAPCRLHGLPPCRHGSPAGCPPPPSPLLTGEAGGRSPLPRRDLVRRVPRGRRLIPPAPAPPGRSAPAATGGRPPGRGPRPRRSGTRRAPRTSPGRPGPGRRAWAGRRAGSARRRGGRPGPPGRCSAGATRPTACAPGASAFGRAGS